VFRRITRKMTLQLGLVTVLLALSTATALGYPTPSRDHPYAARSHPYAVTTAAPSASPQAASGDPFAWGAFALGVSIPLAAILLGVAALTVRAGRVPGIRAAR
jgi:hypothetical protein